jgi:hypothetical protein
MFKVIPTSLESSIKTRPRCLRVYRPTAGSSDWSNPVSEAADRNVTQHEPEKAAMHRCPKMAAAHHRAEPHARGFRLLSQFFQAPLFHEMEILVSFCAQSHPGRSHS